MGPPSLPTPPTRPSLSRGGEGPLGGARGSAGGCGGGGLSDGLIGHDSGGELGLGLQKAGIGLPVQAVDLERGRAERADTRYTRQFILRACPL